MCCRVLVVGGGAILAYVAYMRTSGATPVCAAYMRTSGAILAYFAFIRTSSAILVCAAYMRTCLIWLCVDGLSTREGLRAWGMVCTQVRDSVHSKCTHSVEEGNGEVESNQQQVTISKDTHQKLRGPSRIIVRAKSDELDVQGVSALEFFPEGVCGFLLLLPLMGLVDTLP